MSSGILSKIGIKRSAPSAPSSGNNDDTKFQQLSSTPIGSFPPRRYGVHRFLVPSRSSAMSSTSSNSNKSDLHFELCIEIDPTFLKTQDIHTMFGSEGLETNGT